MSEIKHRVERSGPDGYFVFDTNYLRDEAKVAIKTFAAPFLGVLQAAKGTKHTPAEVRAARQQAARRRAIRTAKAAERREA